MNYDLHQEIFSEGVVLKVLFFICFLCSGAFAGECKIRAVKKTDGFWNLFGVSDKFEYTVDKYFDCVLEGFRIMRIEKTVEYTDCRGPGGCEKFTTMQTYKKVLLKYKDGDFKQGGLIK